MFAELPIYGTLIVVRIGVIGIVTFYSTGDAICFNNRTVLFLPGTFTMAPGFFFFSYLRTLMKITERSI